METENGCQRSDEECGILPVRLGWLVGANKNPYRLLYERADNDDSTIFLVRIVEKRGELEMVEVLDTRSAEGLPTGKRDLWMAFQSPADAMFDSFDAAQARAVQIADQIRQLGGVAPPWFTTREY